MKSLRNISRIAALELGNLFCSPIAWFIAMLFIIQSGLIFTDLLWSMILDFNPSLHHYNYTEKLFGIHPPWSFGLFPGVQAYLYFYIPLLTMGLISREVSSGSIRLLQSSPLTSFEIVAGKYLSIMIYGLILILTLVIFLATGFFSISSLDIPLVLSGMLGLYLLLCVYAAVGLYMSSLTSYQAVAAIGTLSVLAFLNYVDRIDKSMALLRPISHFLNLKQWSDSFLLGLISTRNLFYYAIISTFFTGLTVARLENKKNPSNSLLKRTFRVSILLASCIFLIYLSSIQSLTGYIDVTKNQSQTLTLNTRKILNQIHDHIYVHDYANILDRWYSYKEVVDGVNRDRVLFEKYQRFKPDITIDHTYYYDSCAHPIVLVKGLTLLQEALKASRILDFDFNRLETPENIREKIDLRPEQHQFVRQIRSGNKTTFLRVFEYSSSYKEKTPNPSENEVADALLRLVIKPPKIVFLTGNGERQIYQQGDFGYYHATIQVDCRGALINRGFDVDTLDLQKENIPDSLSALVIADPRFSFGTQELNKLIEYIDDGGNLLIMAGPGGQTILNPVLEYIGAKLKQGQLYQPENENGQDFILAGFPETSDVISSSFPEYAKQQDSVTLPSTLGLEYVEKNGFVPSPVLVTGRHVWNKAVADKQDTGAIKYQPDKGDERKSWPVVVSFTRRIKEKNQRIMITGNANFLTENEMERDNVGATRSRELFFAADSFKWLTNSEFPVDAEHADVRNDFRISIGQFYMIRLILLFVLPALLLLSALIFLLKRQRK